MGTLGVGLRLLRRHAGGCMRVGDLESLYCSSLETKDGLHSMLKKSTDGKRHTRCHRSWNLGEHTYTDNLRRPQGIHQAVPWREEPATCLLRDIMHPTPAAGLIVHPFKLFEAGAFTSMGGSIRALAR